MRTIAAFAVAVLVACLACVVVRAAAPADRAYAQEDDARPNVLVIDSGLGDHALTVDRWLGSDTLPIAEDDGFLLETVDTPAWWSQDPADASTSGETAVAPATYVLSNPEGASTFKPKTLIWALDRIHDAGASPKTVIVSAAATGLPVRKYVEDLASQKLSDRNDVAGVVFCGTPHNGYSAIARYPELDAWNAIARTVGLSVDDLKPASRYLDKLGKASLPDYLPVLNVSGVVGDLGFGPTDGVGTASDFSLTAAQENILTSRQVRASASQELGLSKQWMPYANRINYPTRVVDSHVAESVSAQPAYLSSNDVISQVNEFYATCVPGERGDLAGMTVLAIDLSGSMYDVIDENGDKLAAAKEAAKEYLQAMQSRSTLPTARSIAASVIGFNVATSKITDQLDQSALNAIDQMTAYGETDIGLALDEALAELGAVPDGEDTVKRVLLVSDGASTQGKTEEEIIATTVAEACSKGVVIDTIGFGDIGESDASFLQRLSTATGGTSYQASDTEALKMNFFMAYSALLKQLPAEAPVPYAQSQADLSMPILAIAGLVLVVFICLTLALTFRRSVS